MKFFAPSVLFSSLLFGCAVTPAPASTTLTKKDVDAFIELMLGEFETAPDNQDAQILDRRVRVNSPNLEGAWIYAQLNTGPEKKTYRQRVSNIALSEDGRAIIQRSYTLKSPEAFADFWGKPNKFNSLSDKDINRFANEGCVQTWTPTGLDTWTGYVDPKTCIIASKRRNKDIRIEAEALIEGHIYKTNERGFDMQMQQIWGSEPGEYIAFERK